MRARGAGTALHGLQVAWATLVQLAYEHRPELAEVGDFHRATGLPTTLAELGMPAATEAEIADIAALTMTAPHLPNLSVPVDAAGVTSAIHAVERSTGGAASGTRQDKRPV
jgi:glycerol dehydrogenase